MKQQRAFTDRLSFLIGSLVAAPLFPIGFFFVWSIKSGIDGGAIYTITTAALTIGFMFFMVLEFEADGVLSWILGGGAQSPGFALGYVVGLVLKMLAVVHGVAALAFGNMLLRDMSGYVSSLHSSLDNIGALFAILLVLWLWLMTAVCYLGGDGWIRRVRRADRID